MSNTNKNAVVDLSETSNRVTLQAADRLEGESPQVGVGVPTAPQVPKEFLSSEELAEWLGVSVRTVTNLRARHVLPYVQLGRVVRFRRTQVEAALEAHTIDSIRIDLED